MSSSPSSSTGPTPTSAPEQQQAPSTHAELLDAAAADKGVQLAFAAYLEQRPDVSSPIDPRAHAPRVFAILGHLEPAYESLRRNAGEGGADEPWAECLFAYRAKRHLESSSSALADWKPADYWTLPDAAARRGCRAEALERYGFVLEVLARMQEERRLEVLAGVRGRIEAEVALVRGE